MYSKSQASEKNAKFKLLKVIRAKETLISFLLGLFFVWPRSRLHVASTPPGEFTLVAGGGGGGGCR
jgi:hypothetical protein